MAVIETSDIEDSFDEQSSEFEDEEEVDEIELKDNNVSDGTDSDVVNEDDETGDQNSGWANSIGKILKTNKPKKKKTLVLSKAKKINEIKKTTKISAGFEVETNEGEIKQESVEIKNETQNTSENLKKKKKNLLSSTRVKPDILKIGRERALSKIATRGVVQLFNAVRMQQKDIKKKLEEAGPLDVRQEKALKSIDKRDFLNVLMGEKAQSIEIKPRKDVVKESSHSSKNPTWSVLRDDFMMDAKMKDWDKEVEKEMEIEQE